MLSIHLLGRFEVLRGGIPVPAQAWRRRRPADLLKLIAISPEHRLSRARVIDALWPDKDPGAGANNLNRALYDLRLTLGGRYVDVEGASVVLRAGSWIDVDAFEGAVTAGDDEGRRVAVSLYRGDLAPEDPESPWLQTRRRLLRTRFSEVAGIVAHELAAHGEAAEAVTILRRLLAADPAAEEGHRLLMELLAAGGSRADALHQYDEAARALRAAGRGLPSEPLRRLREAIERREVGPAVTPTPLDGARRASLRLLGEADPAPLRGRKAQLDSGIALLAHGSGVLVLLGEAGVGKTRFALELARLAQQRGAVVLAAACTRRPAAPFAPFAAAFADEAREVATAPPDPFEAEAGAPALPPDAARGRLFAGVAQALATAGHGHPVLLLLDDVDAADESSLNLLHHLALRAASLQLTIVATCRETSVRAGSSIQTALAHLDADRLARGLRLPRLALAASAERLADVLADPPPPEVIARICQVTDGNPLLLEQVAHAWEEGGRAEVPRDAPTALRARVERQRGVAGRLLAAGAVIGDRFPLDLAAQAAGLAREETHEALRACVEARLLRDGGARPRFAGSLVRDEVAASLDPARRAALHRAVAEALEAAGRRPGGEDPAPDALAWHWREAFEGLTAFPHLVAAGHRAAACGGLREALGFHEAALVLVTQLGAGASEERFELLESIGRSRLALGELDAAVDALRSAISIEGPDGWRPAPEQRGRALRAVALAIAASGDLAAAIRKLELGVAVDAEAGEESVGLQLLRGRILWHAGRLGLARDAAEACAAEAERIGQPELLAHARELAALSRDAAGQEPPAAPVRHPIERRTAEPLPDPALDPALLLWDGALAGDLATSELHRLATLELGHCRARGEGIAPPLLAIGSLQLATGDLDGAGSALDEALALFSAAGNATGEALALLRLGELRDRRGSLVEGMELLADGLAIAQRSTLRRHLLVRLLAAQAQNRIAAGSIHEAETIAREAADCAVRHGLCATCEAAVRPLLVRIAIERERLDDAAAEARILEELAAARGGRVLLATARLARARVDAALGRKDVALGLLGEARATFDELERRFASAHCARAIARLGGERDAAVEALLPADQAWFG